MKQTISVSLEKQLRVLKRADKSGLMRIRCALSVLCARGAACLERWRVAVHPHTRFSWARDLRLIQVPLARAMGAVLLFSALSALRCRGNAAVSRNSRRAAASGRWANAVPQERAQAGRRHSLASPRIGVGRWENSQARKRRGGGLQCRAVASPGPPLFGTLSLTLPFGEINLDFIASALGYAMGAGSLLLFAPIIVNLLQAKTAKGMSISTWVLQLTAFAGSTLYNISKGHPFSTFAEVRQQPSSSPKRRLLPELT